MLERMGIRGRLLLAFFGISVLGALTGLVALVSFLEIGRVLDQIARYRTPEAIESLEISRQAERMVSATPAMLNANSIAQLEQIRASIESHHTRIGERIASLKENDGVNRKLETMEWTVGQLHSNIQEVYDLIVRRFQIESARERLLGDFLETHSSLLGRLSASTTELDSKINRLRTARLDSAEDTNGIPALIELLGARASLQAANQELSSINEVFLEAQLLQRPDQVAVLSVRGRRALGALEVRAKELDSETAG
ncbi:MAG TPA: hypothetical protein VLL72_07480, partial [Kiloniellales bacterium]|nr:hypothetical protein [Kiloniellales bacterium]